MQAERQYKARRTPSSEHPPAPPRVSPGIETLYHSVSEEVYRQQTAAFASQIVTTQILYKPGVLAGARCTFEGSRWNIYQERDLFKLVPFPPMAGMADWDNNLIQRWENTNARPAAEGVAFYVFDKTYDFSAERFEALQEEYIRHLMSTEVLELYYNPYLKIYRKSQEPEESFYARCLEKARETLEQEVDILEETQTRQENRMKERLQREVMEASTGDAGAESTLENNRQEMDAREASMTADELRQGLAELESQKEKKLEEFEERLRALSREQEKDIFRLNRANIQILRFSLVWLPYTEVIVQEGETRRTELIRSF